MFSGAAKKNAKEAQRLLHGARVPPSNEGGVFEYQRSQETDGEAGGVGGMAVAYRGMGGATITYQISTEHMQTFQRKCSWKGKGR